MAENGSTITVSIGGGYVYATTSGGNLAPSANEANYVIPAEAKRALVERSHLRLVQD